MKRYWRTNLKIILFVLFVAGAAALAQPARTYAMSAQNIVSLINNERQKAGLQPLASNSLLQRSSYAKAADMFAQNYWSHNDPNGSEPWHFFDENGYVFNVGGENLAKNFVSPEGVVGGWMNSTAHKANVLNANYKDIGISAVDGVLLGEQTTLIVAHFGARATAPQKPASTSTAKVIKKTDISAIASPAESSLKPAEVRAQTSTLSDLADLLQIRMPAQPFYSDELRLKGLLPLRWI